jgi:hypothetical protein
MYWWRRIIQLRMFSSSGLSIPSFEPGVVVPIDGLVNRVFSYDPGAVADKFAEQGCGHIGDKLVEGAESSEPGAIHSSWAVPSTSMHRSLPSQGLIR